MSASKGSASGAADGAVAARQPTRASISAPIDDLRTRSATLIKSLTSPSTP
jgi:hypothetical protein